MKAQGVGVRRGWPLTVIEGFKESPKPAPPDLKRIVEVIREDSKGG